MNSIILNDISEIISDNRIDWTIFNGKTVLVAGANSFIASYIIFTLLFRNKSIVNQTKVIALVRDEQKAKNKYIEFLNDTNFLLLKQDITKEMHFECPIDYIFHLASNATPSLFFSKPVDTITANTIGTHNLLKLAYEKKVSGFLYFSSGEVYGDILDKLPIVSENDYGIVSPLDIRNCYSESKRLGENLCVCWAHQYNVPAKVVRLSHTYGPGFSLNDGRAFASFVNCVLQNRDIILRSSGVAKRSYCYLSDAIRAFFKVLLDGNVGEAYNISNDYEISILELAQIIVDASGNSDLTVRIEIDKNSPSSTALHGLLSNAKIKDLGWEPTIKEQEGFRRTILSFKE